MDSLFKADSGHTSNHLSGSIVLAVQLLIEMGAEKRHPYLDFIPKALDVPILWENDELWELAGTTALRAIEARFIVRVC